MSRRNGFPGPKAGAAAPVVANSVPAAPLGRASWSGFLRWSLVVVPVKAYHQYPLLLLHLSLHHGQLDDNSRPLAPLA